MKKLRGIRTDYTKASLLDSEIPENPYNLLCLWMDSAIAEKIPEPTAICLSTIKPNGRVNSRIVLAKEIQEDGVVFFTNYNSAKGQDIAKILSHVRCFSGPRCKGKLGSREQLKRSLRKIPMSITWRGRNLAR